MSDYQRKAIDGFPGYEIDTEGVVWSCKNHQGKLSNEWHKINPVVRKHGKNYFRLQATLWNNNKGKSFFVSRLVAQAFIQNPDNYLMVCHKDSDPFNNKTNNLKWGTAQDNMDDRMARGFYKGEKIARGEQSGTSKLTEKQVIEIKKLCKEELSDTKIAKLFDISRRTINFIRHNKRWKHVTI